MLIFGHDITLLQETITMRPVSQHLCMYWESTWENNVRNHGDIQQSGDNEEDVGAAAVGGDGLVVLLAEAAAASIEKTDAKN